MKKLLYFVAICAFGSGAAWFVGHPSIGSRAATPDTSNKSRVPVVVAEATRRDVPIVLEGLGTVRAYRSVVLTSRIDGEIVKLNFVEGEDVHQGDVLVEIDPQPLAAVLGQAEAAKTRDEALLANARLDFNRAQDLAGKGAGTRQQLDTTRAQVAQLEASVKIDEAAIQAAQVQLNYSRIRAPIDGRAGTRQIDEGNIVRANSTSGIVTINQIHPISVDFDLPAESLAQVRAHLTAGDTTVTAMDRDDHPLAVGKLAVIDNQVNVSTGTVRYKATFDNKNETLWPGQFVAVRLQLDVRHDALTVPAAALQRGPQGTYLFVVDAARVVEKRTVTVDFVNKDLVVVGSGLRAGEQVVIDGQYRIQAGSAVDPSPQAVEASK